MVGHWTKQSKLW